MQRKRNKSYRSPRYVGCFVVVHWNDFWARIFAIRSLFYIACGVCFHIKCKIKWVKEWKTKVISSAQNKWSTRRSDESTLIQKSKKEEKNCQQNDESAINLTLHDKTNSTGHERLVGQFFAKYFTFFFLVKICVVLKKKCVSRMKRKNGFWIGNFYCVVTFFGCGMKKEKKYQQRKRWYNRNWDIFVQRLSALSQSK